MNCFPATSSNYTARTAAVPAKLLAARYSQLLPFSTFTRYRRDEKYFSMAIPTEELGELAKDEAFKSVINKFHLSVDKVGDALELCCGRDVYADLSPEEKVEYDLFLSYSLNSLFWSYLRTQGVDPLKHGVKNELDRVKSYMTRAKQVREKQSMPRIDKDAAERFVTSGLWEPGQAKIKPGSGNGVNKRKRLESDSEEET